MNESSEPRTSRRAFLAKGAAAGALTLGAGRLLIDTPAALAGEALPAGDAAILQFLAAAELLEADLWKQYNELGGVQDGEVGGGSGNRAYTKALAVIDKDMHQYIHDNADDEQSHADFINAYLRARGAQSINLDPFRTLPGSKASGAAQIGRLTNLMELTVDTSYWTRYRDDYLRPRKHLQAIANTAAFHFGMIEQGGTSLYASLAQRVSDPEVLRILLSIGPTEVMHFQTWQDKAGNAPALTDPTNGLVFPDLNKGGEDVKPNRIMPEPTVFLDRKLAICSILRPTETVGAAVGAVNGLAASGLFTGQSQEFFSAATALAQAADAATRG